METFISSHPRPSHPPVEGLWVLGPRHLRIRVGHVPRLEAADEVAGGVAEAALVQPADILQPRLGDKAEQLGVNRLVTGPRDCTDGAGSGVEGVGTREGSLGAAGAAP